MRCVCQACMWIITAYTFIDYNCWNKTCVDQSHGEIISRCDNREFIRNGIPSQGIQGVVRHHCLLKQVRRRHFLASFVVLAATFLNLGLRWNFDGVFLVLVLYRHRPLVAPSLAPCRLRPQAPPLWRLACWVEQCHLCRFFRLPHSCHLPLQAWASVFSSESVFHVSEVGDEHPRSGFVMADRRTHP